MYLKFDLESVQSHVFIPCFPQCKTVHLAGVLGLYRPQRSCVKVMFSHVSVILFTVAGVANTPPPTSPEMATAADVMHPTGMYSCSMHISAPLHRPKKLNCVRFLVLRIILFGKVFFCAFQGLCDSKNNRQQCEEQPISLGGAS